MSDRSSNERKLIGTSRERGSSFDLYEVERERSFYVDGSSGAILSNHVTRVSFFEVKSVDSSPNENNTPIEDRENIINIRMPTLAWARLAENILRTLKENHDVISMQGRDQEDEIKQLVDKLV